MKPGDHVALACNFHFTRKWLIITLQPRNYGSITGKDRRFSLKRGFQTGSGACPTSYSVGTEGSFPQGKFPGVKLTRRPPNADFKN
jgi:hypothetical protein